MLLQLPFHGIDPVFFRLGPVELRWYGLMYMFGFIVAYFIMRRAIAVPTNPLHLRMSRDDLYDLLFYLILGVMIGGRLGYIVLYDISTYLENPAAVIAVWRGGMSFHGGLIGTVVAAILVSRKKRWDFWRVADLGAIAAPPGIALVRIGNFINGELYGRVTELPWAMLFPGGGPQGRHPSQLYEAMLEGVVLFFAVGWLYRKRFRPGTAFWGLVGGYGLVRFLVEFVREPDSHLGFDLGPFSRGQVLSFPMLVAGSLFLFLAIRAASEARPDHRPERRPKKR